MSVLALVNRMTYAAFRTRLETWRAAINTSISDITAIEGDVTTLQSEMNTAQADILLRQLANARSTLNLNYRATAISITCLNTDYNGLIDVTNVAATNFTLPAPSSLTAFVAGTTVILSNAVASTDNVTVVPSGSTYIGSTAIIPGECAYIVMISATTWRRLALTKG